MKWSLRIGLFQGYLDMSNFMKHNPTYTINEEVNDKITKRSG